MCVCPLTERVGMEQVYEIFSTFGELVDIVIQEDGGRRSALVRFRNRRWTEPKCSVTRKLVWPFHIFVSLAKLKGHRPSADLG